jgi:hypothetical protein
MSYQEKPLPLPFGFVREKSIGVNATVSNMKVGDKRKLKTTKEIHSRYEAHERKYGYKFKITIEGHYAIVERIE